MLTLIGLTVAAPTFNGRVLAANIQAKPAHEGRADLVKPRRVAQSSCRPQRIPTRQLIAEVLSQPWFIGQPPPMYINGVRLCVDPHGEYVPSEYQYNPATGSYELQ
jgi:hypothetical protein